MSMEDILAIDSETRRNFVFAVISTSPSPTGKGSKVDWLEYYKLNPELGETYVFLDLEIGAAPVEEGDILWFQVDDRIIARVRICRTFLDPYNDQVELWYRCSEVQRIDGVQTMERGSRLVSSKASWIPTTLATIPSAGLS
jgi:hypothetical protein